MQYYKTIIRVALINAILLANILVSFAQAPPPPDPNGGGNGGGLPVGGNANLDINVYIWLLPIVVYMCYKLAERMRYYYKTK